MDMTIKSFDEVVLFARTGLNPRNNFKLGQGTNKYITIKNIKNNSIVIDDNTDVVDDDAISLIHKRSQIKKGDVLFCSIGRMGDMYIISEEPIGWDINESVFVFTLNTEVIRQKYFYYIFKHQNTLDYLSKNSSGSTFKSIKMNQLKKMNFCLPSLKEQDFIVSALDSACSIINARKKELDKLDELVKARFVEMFGDSGKQVPLTEYVWFQEGPGVRSVDFTNEGTTLLTGSNINNNTITFGYKSDRHISNELANGKYAHFMCDKDDILVVSSAIDPDKFDKKVAIVNENKKYCLNTGIIRFKPDKNHLTLGYFREFLKTDYFKHQVIAEMRGIAQMHFGPSHLKQMTILLPESIEKQIEFENFVKQIDKSKVAVQKALDEAQLLFDSLMQEYFG